jgi:predicted RND superfamily exporter protein
MLSRKTSSCTFEKIETIAGMFSDHREQIKPLVKPRMISRVPPGIWKLNKHFQIINKLRKKSQERLENILNQMKMKMQLVKVWNAAKAVLGGKQIALNAYFGGKVFYFKKLQLEVSPL